MKPDTPPTLPPPRRHAPLSVSKPAPRTLARVTDAAGWKVKRRVAFNAAI